MKKRTAFLLSLLLLFTEPLLWAGLGGDKAMYMGGTVPDLKEKTEGRCSTADGKAFIFQYKGGSLSIPYEQVNSLEYGQKAGRRVGLAVVVNPFFLFSKKRRHYLTIGWVDENKKQQAAVLELGKGVIKETLSSLETKTGKNIEYQDEEARKTGTSK
ncbi:MAG: hypothetical protein M3O85_00645 [Acidobacteriota bacterium]|nr:hypothetical protein [Acidobacteriota bacterium]